jgi:8-amino-7-oxononanoate synthase
MTGFDGVLRERLEAMREGGLERHLPEFRGDLIDLCSNDYLGLAKSPELRMRIAAAVAAEEERVGSTGSRLLTGNSELAEETERELATHFQGEAALVFSSGYAANVGLISAVVGREDVVLFDELIHASLRDGIRLSGVKGWKFRHNNLSDLSDKLARAPRRGRVWVVVESVYSMDGDRCPLREVVALCERWGADCIVDEAHSTGIFGKNGSGMVVDEGLEDRVVARVHTFGKGVGVHGACVVGSSVLRRWLINRARSFVYSTAPADTFFIAIREAVRAGGGEEGDARRRALWDRISVMEAVLGAAGLAWRGESPIVPIVMPGVAVVRAMATAAREAGYQVLPILAPTVPSGLERIRVCLHAGDDPAVYKSLIQVFEEQGWRAGLGGGE